MSFLAGFNDAQRLATAAIQQHQTAPVLLRVGALHLTDEFHGFRQHVIVLHAHQEEIVAALRPEFGDVTAAEQVAVHEDGPAAVAHQSGHQVAGEGDGRALPGIPRPPVETLALQLRRTPVV
jgi:hypothetical protein